MNKKTIMSSVIQVVDINDIVIKPSPITCEHPSPFNEFQLRDRSSTNA
jgi:hypothetical protein